MPLAMPELDTETFTFTEEDVSHSCQHYAHPRGQRGHSDASPLLMVMGIPIPCCGFIAKITYLCASWVKENETLRCPKCDIGGLLFEECYIILGPA